MKKHCQFYFLVKALGVVFAIFSVAAPALAWSQVQAEAKADAKSQANGHPLKVFLLVGQSNMQGHAHVKTLEHLRQDPESQALSKRVQDEQGKPLTHDDVWISYLSTQGVRTGKLTVGFGATQEKIGPELMFGVRMREAFDEPILIIKTAWGGKSLHTDFRPPSAGPFKFSEQQLAQFEKQGKDIDEIQAAKKNATGHFYRETIQHVREVLKDVSAVYPDYDADSGYQLAGVVWFQGWNDMVDRGAYPNRGEPNGYGQYAELMAHFIRDIRRDLKVPQVPFVIGVLGVGGPTAKYGPDQKRYEKIHQNFRDAMAAPASMPEFENNVAAVLTENCWDLELTRLRNVQAEVNQRLRKQKQEEKLTREQERQARDALNAELFQENELATLEMAVSNAEFHYLGSAKILCRIGDAFAEAMLKLQAVDSANGPVLKAKN